MAGPSHFRAFPRRASRIAVVAKLAAGEARVRLIDIGLGGAGVQSGEVLELGARLDLVLQVPNRWDPLVLPARVAWSNGKRAGLAFEHRDDADVYALYELLGTQVFDK